MKAYVHASYPQTMHQIYNYEGMRCALGSSPLFIYCHLWYTVPSVTGPTSMQTDVNRCARSYVDHTLVPNTRHWMIYLTNHSMLTFYQSLINVAPCTSVRNSKLPLIFMCGATMFQGRHVFMIELEVQEIY